MGELNAQKARKKYLNPPVIEIAADFQMPRSSGQEWDWDQTVSFLEKTIESGEPIESLQEMKVRRERGRPSKTSKRKTSDLQLTENTLRMRRYALGRAHCVQIAPDRLIVNCVRSEQQTPTYTVLEPLLLKYLTAYQEFFTPDGIESLSLSYVDDVALPITPKVDLTQYFNIRVDFPEVFGSAQSFNIRGEWADGPLKVRLELKDVKPFTFRLDWQATKSLPGASPIPDALAALAECRRVLRERFEASLTDQTRQLFNPE